jgi:hypothetical protein
LLESEVVAEVKVVLLDDAAAAGRRDDHEIGQALFSRRVMASSSLASASS